MSHGVLTSAGADVRFSVDASGELYMCGKSDGVIRRVVGGTGF